MDMEKKEFRSGFVTIVGRPNVGKSTLLNALVGEKVAIVSNKPQTTRTKMMGIMSEENAQIVFVDTPGIHQPRTKLGEYMETSLMDAMDSIDGLVVLLDASSVFNKDREVVQKMSEKKCYKLLILNKTDLIAKNSLLTLMDEFKNLSYDAILPVSAMNGEGVEELKNQLMAHMPVGPKYFPDDMLTDQPERVLCAEIIREKTLLNLRDEVPHGIGVEMMAMKKENDKFMEIDATLYCEKSSHKGIIIGKNGSMLKKIGQEARMDIERLLDMHINLRLWVKVREDWRNSVQDLRTLGYMKEK